MQYYIWTIGCQMNKADSERLASALEHLGLEESAAPKDADVIVLNSCVVRQSAEDRVTGMLSLLKPLKQCNPGRVVALMGCAVGPRDDDLRRRFPYVDLFMPPQQYEPLIDLLGRRLGRYVDDCLRDLTPARPQVTSYVPIVHGCDKFCTFCIVPYRRGRERSRSVVDVAREVATLARRGVREVTLLGQNVDSYGHDLEGSPDLADLLAEVSNVEGVERIRALTSHPNDMSDRIIHAVAGLPKVCKHINLPFQAGDDEVLRNMRRGYTAGDYRRLVERIRAAIPSVSMSTDVIVGFPGETEGQFQATLDLIRDIRFDKVHAAAYSARPGTIAARNMVDDVPLQDKKERLQALEELQERIASEINASLLGQRVEVLVDSSHKGRWQGRSRNDKLVFFPHEDDLLGEMVQVRIEKTSPWSLQGILVD